MSDTAPAAAGPVVITLSRPVEVIDKMVSTVTITPPTGRHLMKAGSVMRFINSDTGNETAVEMNPDGMGKLIAACANLTLRSVEMMTAGDFMACSVALMGFLAPTPVPEVPAEATPLERYFDLARFWNDLGFVMDRTLAELDTMLRHSERIAARENEK